ncbi:MAG: DUF3014 domain-containing protein [Candidatus Aminicenantia bacterium]
MEEYKKVVLTGVIFIALVGIGLGIYYFFIYKKSQKPLSFPEVIEEQPSPVSLGKPIREEEKMARELAGLDLDNSDDMVRKLAKELSSYPQLAVWLRNEDLLRKFTAVVDNIANGLSPRPHIEFLAPQGDFQVIEKDGLFYVNPVSFDRYNLVADVFASLDSEGCVKLYGQLKPLVQEAYRDLGYPTQDFQETLFKAIIELLKTPVIEGEILLEEKVVTYMMVAPRLENLSPAQKHLLRMGPENVRKIQAKLREMALALGIPESQLPQSVVYYPDNRKY